MKRSAFTWIVTLGLIMTVPAIARAQMLDADQWTESEDGGWTAVWTFDRDHRTMSGNWHNAQTGERVHAADMHVRREGRQIVISRPGLGNYVGTLAPDGRSINGTLSWTAGHFRAAIAPPGFDEHGGGDRGFADQRPGEPGLLAAGSWTVGEDGGWTAIWTFDRDRRTMSGEWTNHSTGERVHASGMTVRQSGNQLIIARPGLGNYVGTLSPDGRSIEGTLSWSSGRFHAQAR